MTTFDSAFRRTVGIEGKYSNNPADSGGETMYGITAALARAYGYKGAMRDLPLATAKDIYLLEFWTPLKLNAIDALGYSAVAIELFDSAVNCGRPAAGKWLQIALNALNNEGKLYPEVSEDGNIGPATLSALTGYAANRKGNGQLVLLRALNCLQGAFYIDLTRKRQKDEAFVFGWLLNRVEV